jgi:4-amino-4-deoxy-L-arabinose transferase-like glycosyltransferase
VRHAYIIAVFLVFAAGIFLRIAFLNVPAYYSEYDEGYYLRYAAYIAQDHNASFANLSDAYLRNESWHIYPNPLRAGYIITAGLAMRLFGRFDFKMLSYISSFFSIAALFVCFFFAKRLLGKRAAFLSLVLLIASPLGLALARRALPDSMAYFFIITALYFFYEALHEQSFSVKLAFAISFFMAIAVKENSALLSIFFALFILLDKKLFNPRLEASGLLFAILLVLAGSFLMCIRITGGIDKLFQMAKIIIPSPYTNEYAIKYQSGNFLSYVVDFFALSPVTLVLAMSFIAIYLKNTGINREPFVFLVSFLIIYYLIFSLFSKNVRYVAALDFPVRIMAASFISAFCGRLGRSGAFAAILACCVIAAMDLLIFQNIFIVHDVYDPVTQNLAWAWTR